MTEGAFTGALNAGKPGLIESGPRRHRLFLDEINSLPLALQGKLLRVLESHKSKRLGAVEEQEIDFRLLAATNQNLKACVLARHVPGGSLLPPERHPAGTATRCGSGGRTSPLWPPSSWTTSASATAAPRSSTRPSACEQLKALRLAGQHPGAEKRGGAAAGHQRRRGRWRSTRIPAPLLGEDARPTPAASGGLPRRLGRHSTGSTRSVSP